MRANSSYETLFSDADKCGMFDELACMFYDKNFGQTTKAVIELRMFSWYMERLEATESKIDEFLIGKELGIKEKEIIGWEASIVFQGGDDIGN